MAGVAALCHNCSHLAGMRNAAKAGATMRAWLSRRRRRLALCRSSAAGVISSQLKAIGSINEERETQYSQCGSSNVAMK